MTSALPPILFNAALDRFRKEHEVLAIPTGRYRARVWTWGNGPDLLFIHGMSDRSDSFVSIASELSKNYRCIGYDLAGVDPNDGAKLFGYKHTHLAEDAIAILDKLGVGESNILAASFGTTIAQRLLHDYPGRFPAAILQGAFPHRPLGWKNYLMALVGRFLGKKPMLSFPKYDQTLHAVYGNDFAHREAEAWNWFLQCVGNSPLGTMAHQACMIANLDLRPILPSISQPVLLLCGEKDKVVKPQATAPLVKLLPNREHFLHPEWGHVPCYTHPEEMVDQVQRFLRAKGLS
mgnify:CR=1 FL=1